MDNPENFPHPERSTFAMIDTVYEELQQIARSRMANERGSHTLQATALVNEAYLRLQGSANATWESKSQFLAAASVAMRRILIDHARRRGAKKRCPENLSDIETVADLSKDENLSYALALDEGLLRLEEEDPQAAQVVKLRFYCGLSVEETAEAMAISDRTVKRDWAYARTFLLQFLEKD